MRQGDFPSAVRNFAKVAKALPEDPAARRREIAALIAMGLKAHAKALERVSEARLIHPEDGPLTRQMIRLLAASPDPDVRAGQRALTLAMELFERALEANPEHLNARTNLELVRSMIGG